MTQSGCHLLKTALFATLSTVELRRMSPGLTPGAGTLKDL
jgi:hypothetical protein